MEWAALIFWVVTAGGGFVLLSIWLARGGMRQQGETGNRIRPPLILSHFLLAAGGLVVWIIYLASDKDALAWIAFVVLAIVAALGWTMFAIWLRQRQARATGREAAAGSAGGSELAAPGTPAEQHFPVSIVALHGLLAVTTVVLVLLTALGVGGS
jgi:hypothetical protein